MVCLYLGSWAGRGRGAGRGAGAVLIKFSQVESSAAFVVSQRVAAGFSPLGSSVLRIVTPNPCPWTGSAPYSSGSPPIEGCVFGNPWPVAALKPKLEGHTKGPC
jgi:hypothetical protein